jgi:hypothetical protein
VVGGRIWTGVGHLELLGCVTTVSQQCGNSVTTVKQQRTNRVPTE